MTSKSMIYSLLLIHSIFFSLTAYAESARGVHLWKEKCLSCHITQSEIVVNEAFYATIQWERFLKQDRHPKKVKVVLTDEEKKLILEYVRTKSADSDSPAVAGIR